MKGNNRKWQRKIGNETSSLRPPYRIHQDSPSHNDRNHYDNDKMRKKKNDHRKQPQLIHIHDNEETSSLRPPSRIHQESHSKNSRKHYNDDKTLKEKNDSRKQPQLIHIRDKEESQEGELSYNNHRTHGPFDDDKTRKEKNYRRKQLQLIHIRDNEESQEGKLSYSNHRTHSPCDEDKTWKEKNYRRKQPQFIYFSDDEENQQEENLEEEINYSSSSVTTYTHHQERAPNPNAVVEAEVCLASTENDIIKDTRNRTYNCWKEGSAPSPHQRRTICLICVLVVIVVIIVGIAVPRALTKENEKECTADFSCHFNHAHGKCTNGKCIMGACEIQYDNCNRNTNDGCEVDLQNNSNHCGSCGNTCNLANAKSKCDGGLCVVDTCLDGTFVDCDGKSSTGCEANLLLNDYHCGACNSKCTGGEYCVDGICVNVQRPALMSLYESTNGPNWYTGAQTNWGSPNVNECDWHGVTCNNEKVTGLEKYFDNLKGTIPTEVGLLTELTHLSLSSNDLSGPIPSTFGSLTKLTILRLSTNGLTGVIPTELGRLTNVNSLWLEDNYLSGTLPSDMASMTKLTYLYVYLNNLYNIPNEICEMEISNFGGDCPPCSLECCTKCYP